MRIVINDDWRISPKGVITGTIYFEDGEWSFPCLMYPDFPVWCVESWIDSVTDLLIKKRNRLKYHDILLFYDGPYLIDVLHDYTDSEVLLTSYSDFSVEDDSIIGEGEPTGIKRMKLIEMIEMIIIAGETVMNIANRRQIVDRRHKEVLSLQRKLKALIDLNNIVLCQETQ